jgi:glycine/D-amino acid oxidase-like deaminating enzyme/nitrite reductase/ring-hydroxylating ferredoxin subunit
MTSFWNATAPADVYDPLEGRVEADVAIVGGGLVGVTTARLCADLGLRVVLLEARRIGEEVTGKSTAKITSQHNIKYRTLASKFGEDKARLYAEANQAGLRRIEELAARHGIACDLEPQPAYVFTDDESQVSAIEDEVEIAKRLGLPASLAGGDIGLPFSVKAAMRWDDQAQFHPVKYVKGLAAACAKDGVAVHEGARVIDWSADRLQTDRGEVHARHIVMATHMPLGQIGLFYAEAYPHVHPVIMGRADPARAPRGMFINVENPRRSMRAHRDARGDTWMIFSGTAFKPGHTEEERTHMAEVARFAAERFGVEPEYRWTNEDFTPMDDAPFVGWSSSLPSAYLVATGFDAWGITNGTAAAMMIAETIAGRDHPWLKLFDARRIKPIAGGAEFVKENASVAAHLVGGYVAHKPRDFDAIGPGEAAVLKVDGDNVAAFRDQSGRVHAVSAVCTHMGCLVGWNETDRTWDCPCHGSRFTLTGEVLHGPAVTPLARKDPAA